MLGVDAAGAGAGATEGATTGTDSFFSISGGTSRAGSKLGGATEEGEATNDCICFSICWWE